MTPQQLQRLDKLEKLVQSLIDVKHVPFIANLERRATPGILDDSSTTTVTTLIKSVNEAGASAYNVADAPDRKVGVVFADGTSGFIGVYNT